MNLSLIDIFYSISPVFILIASLAVYLVTSYLKLSQLEMIVAVIFASVPTAVSSFALARQLGGETNLMARIISTQVALSFITIPLVLTLII